MASQGRVLSKARKIGYRDTVQVTLSSAQCLALDTTPITLIPAPGAGQAIFIEEYLAFLDFNSVAYTGGALELHYTNAAGTAIVAFDASWFRAAADSHIMGLGDGQGNPAIGTLLTANAPVVICDAGTLADGNSPIKIKLRYRIVPLLT